VNFVINEKADHVHVVGTGKFDLRVARQVFDEAFALCEARGLNRIFIDAREISTQVSIADRHELGTYLAAQRRIPLRIAFLLSELHIAFSKVVEDTANNRGLPVISTASESEAWEWLGLPAP
jgi:hypothetical protein